MSTATTTRYLPFLVTAEGGLESRTNYQGEHVEGGVLDFATTEDAIKASGLDYDIVKGSLSTSWIDENGVGYGEVEGYSSLLKVQNGQTTVLPATVGSNQAIFQNLPVFATVDTACGAAGARWVSARSLKGGLGMQLHAKLPDAVNVGGFDPIDSFIKVTNWHDGSGSLELAVMNYRRVCTNGLHAITQGNVIRMRHTSRADLKDLEIDRLFATVEQSNRELAVAGERMLNTDLTEEQMAYTIAQLFPYNDRMSVKARNNVTRAREGVYNAFFNDTQDGIRDTAWGGYQAFVEYADWGTVATKGETQRAERQLTGTHDKTKQRAFEAFMALA